MAEGTKGGVNPSALAAALLAEAESFQPKKGAAYETLSNPEVYEAVTRMADKGMSFPAIADVLTKNGFAISGKTVRETLKKINGGDTHGKQEGKPKATKPRPSAEARKEVKQDAKRTQQGSDGNAGSAPGNGAGKPAQATDTAKPTEPAKGQGGGASKKPTMAANIDPNEL